jgi:hypothetical protein
VRSRHRVSAEDGSCDPNTGAGDVVGMFEEHLSTTELAKILHMSTDKARDLVMFEPGVLCFTGKGGKKTMYRIPRSVVERILRRSTNPGPIG